MHGNSRSNRSVAVVLAVLLPGCAAANKVSEAPGMPDMAPGVSVGAMAESAPMPSSARGGAPQTAGFPAPAASPGTTASPEPPALLVYEATLTVGVYQVREAMDAVLAVARASGGHVIFRDDARVTFRVPRAKFESALASLDGVGDIVHRDIRAEDVGDQFRDLEVRLKNARAMRDRLEQLLTRANTVEDSLKIEHQLARITEEIERLSGAITLLSHRIDFSKITVVFDVRHHEKVAREAVRLPFPWLKSLGLSNLLKLEEKSDEE